MKFKRGFNPKNIAAALVCIVGFSGVAYGSDMSNTVKNYTLGDHAHFVLPELDDNGLERDYSGNLIDNYIYFVDENGNRLSEIPKDGSIVYSADGSAMFSVSNNDNTFDYSNVTLFNSFDDAKPYLAFNLLEPTVLPEGFKIDKIYLYNDENGNHAEEGMSYFLHYDLINDEGQIIYVHVRAMNEETALTTEVTHNVKEIDINGNKALLDEGTLNVYIDGVLYMIMDSGDNSRSNELVEMAESLK